MIHRFSGGSVGLRAMQEIRKNDLPGVSIAEIHSELVWWSNPTSSADVRYDVVLPQFFWVR